MATFLPGWKPNTLLAGTRTCSLVFGLRAFRAAPPDRKDPEVAEFHSPGLFDRLEDGVQGALDDPFREDLICVDLCGNPANHLFLSQDRLLPSSAKGPPGRSRGGTFWISPSLPGFAISGSGVRKLAQRGTGSRQKKGASEGLSDRGNSFMRKQLCKACHRFGVSVWDA